MDIATLTATFPQADPAVLTQLAALDAATGPKPHPQPTFGNGSEPELHDTYTHPDAADWAAEVDARRYFDV